MHARYPTACTVHAPCLVIDTFLLILPPSPPHTHTTTTTNQAYLGCTLTHHGHFDALLNEHLEGAQQGLTAPPPPLLQSLSPSPPGRPLSHPPPPGHAHVDRTLDAPWLIIDTLIPSSMNTLKVRSRISLVRSTLQMSDRMAMLGFTLTAATRSSS